MAAFLIQRTPFAVCAVELWDKQKSEKETANVKTDLSENTAAFSHEGHSTHSEPLLFSEMFFFSAPKGHPTVFK